MKRTKENRYKGRQEGERENCGVRVAFFEDVCVVLCLSQMDKQMLVSIS